MSSRVPEGNPQSHEAQLERLRNDLAGNAAFGRMRGKMGATLISHARSIASGSARHAMEEWDGDNAAMRVMMNLLRKYGAEGLEIAIEELCMALVDPNYRVTGETVPFEQTSPFTIVVINPEETFALLKWMQGFGNENFEKMFVAIDSVVSDGVAIDDPVRKRMIERARACRERVKTEGGTHALLTAFSERLHQVPGKVVTSAGASFYPVSLTHFLPSDQRRVCYDGDTHGGGVRSTDWARAKVATITRPVPKATCALGFPEEQSTILSAFSREVQHALVASWQFRYPRATHNLGGAHKGFSVGFHPEDEHARWRRERPQFASLGVSHGWGAILLPNSEPGVESWYSGEAPHFVLERFIRKAKGNRW